MSREICRFHGTPAGCRRGNTCNFLHVDDARAPRMATRGRIRPGRGGAPSRAPTGNNTNTNDGVPPNVCSFFWKTGDCTRGFRCRASHVVDPARAAAAGDTTVASSIPADLAPFLTDAGLARLIDNSTDVLFGTSTKPKSPAEVHNFLKRFLYDNYQFRNTLDVYSFLALLNDANTNNTSWSSEDAQMLLNAVAKDNGYKRMCDIIGWQEVSSRAGNRKDVLSFQRGYIPLLQYLCSDFVTKSILTFLTNALYVLLKEHIGLFANNVRKCMEDMLAARSFKDPQGPHGTGKPDVGGVQVFSSLAAILHQLLTRIKNVVATEPVIGPLVMDLQRWAETWSEDISKATPTFQDPLCSQPTQTRLHLVGHIEAKIQQLVSIVTREQNKHDRARRSDQQAKIKNSPDGILAILHTTYDGPGEARKDGPRHDNDFIDITDIRIAPTHEELTCRIPPFLPANRYGAPHPHEQGSVQLLQDVQFRLLREELTASLRTSIQAVLDDLSSPAGKRPTQLAEVLKKKGGRYRGQAHGGDTLLFNMYSGANFENITPDWRGLSVSVSIDTPPGRARSPQTRARQSFWEGMSGKRLMSGGLVALIWQRGEEVNVHLGVISSSLRDLVDSSKHNANRITIRINFFDPSVELRILQDLHTPSESRSGLKLLVEATVMYESIRPFLEAIRVEPTTIPFTKYIVHQTDEALRNTLIDPPRYSRLRGFTFELSSLFPDGSVESLKLRTDDADSIANARQQLKQNSRLDLSQADSVVDALTRELTLIQGPPGTGKSYTGVQLIRVLLANNAGPILMIAFTNHALDHMLSSVLEADITKKIVRLGSRSADETISQFSLENIEKVAGKSRLNRAFASLHYELKQSQEAVERFMKDYLKAHVESESILIFLEVIYPEQHQDFISPPEWINTLHKTNRDAASQWQRVGKGGKTSDTDDSLYAYWLSGSDLEFLQAAHASQAAPFVAPQNLHPSSSNAFAALVDTVEDHTLADDASLPDSVEIESDDELDEDLPPEERWQQQEAEPQPAASSGRAEKQPLFTAPSVVPPAVVEEDHAPLVGLHPSDIRDLTLFFEHFGLYEIPPLPTSNLPADALLERASIWDLSLPERQRLHHRWSNEVRLHLQENQIFEFETLRRRYQQALNNYEEARSASRSELLKGVDIIGCTTNGAAKLASLLQAVGPRIMLVEEAGQVLEAHILGSLVPTVQHLILIGDPLQLRPTIENYALSMDHNLGGQIYKFDQSLMERLSSSGFAMSQINVQRRMRPQISSLIRTYLYPQLEDHELVKQHPDVRGLAKNVFFLTHNHKENAGEDDSVSKFNQYEVDMVVDLVMHLLRQGPYSTEGDIVVLCAYLGQLARMRDAFADKVAVVIDERDQVQLADQEGEKEEDPLEPLTAIIDHVKVTRRVRLRTIDNYQGEEAKIVILTLVRNSGGSDDDEGLHGHSRKGNVNVGFLKSVNRTNVALSRAREGLFILGNAVDLSSRSKMWKSVVEELDRDGCVGPALPVVCAQHKDKIQYVSKPGQLPRIAPDGGCLRQCDARLKCGHKCPYKCHSDDPHHVAVRCEQSCTKLCTRGHPCTKACAEDCGKCLTRISGVKLPCGHVKDFVFWCAIRLFVILNAVTLNVGFQISCELDDLESVACTVAVQKALPQCEHEATTTCSTDPATIKCKKICDGAMNCCGRSCGARNTPVRGDCTASICAGKLARKTMSAPHNARTRVGKSVFIHGATITARRRALLVRSLVPGTVFTRSALYPAALYALAFHVTNVANRLWIVATDVPQDEVVDQILFRTLADVDPDMETVDDMLITLPNCRHVFTIETLDGICDMSVFYERSADDTKWIGLKTPPSGYRKPPTCPTCRSAITAPRYGRIFKRADLDILENNVASSMSQSLLKAADKVNVISTQPLNDRLKLAAQELQPSLSKVPGGDFKKRLRRQAAILRETRNTPVAFPHINASNDLHAVPELEVNPWRRVIGPLLAAYREAVAVASTRSAHIHAWEASFSFLYNQETQNAMLNPERAPRGNLQEYAMRMAKIKVGQPQPRADMRFRVEAFWMTINIRLLLIELAQAWADELSSGPDGDKNFNRRLWDGYVSFLLRSCKQDADITLKVTQESESRRQTVRTHLLILRIELASFKFNIEVTRRREDFSMEKRSELANSCHERLNKAKAGIRSVSLEHMKTSQADPASEREWVMVNFTAQAKGILDSWEDIETSLRRDTFYQTVSRDEMSDIVKAMRSNYDFSHTGHFYQCPNGHTYVIGDCG
ncbi:hypothetical protein EIP91_010850, partial [Steccherinum ochraceum]